MNAIDKQLQLQPNRRMSYIMTMIILSLLFIWSVTAIHFENVSASGTKIAKNIFVGLLNPDWSLIMNVTTEGIPYLLIETMAIAFLGTIVGALLAIPLAFLSASTIVPKPVAFIVRFLLIMIRTIPAIIYGLMFIRVTGPGPFAGVLTMSLTSIGMLSKLYVDVIEDLDKSILESMEAIGCTLMEKIRFGIWPQLTALFTSIVIYRFDMNLRDATVLGLVGAGGIGAPLIFAMNSYKWSEVGAILLGLVVLILLVEYVSNRARTKLVKG
ncbi:phosphonate ABC transporter, permease protein PhnE [Lysinibacillus fusiformis]|uniref:phosphonate ABC transporter, permease protein PhnE n=1 Tax=Lysinibacillus fusiformis TaxID=28031 RepID=UPI00088443FD|nr:phosphonate ABC transporter, permease protein PhnE [Lysinibacillus fusiformis]SCX39002.1 phosphonate transport system permease protein [Lysinibacillus fusiformis]SDB06745.1 phosphonate transport system permease protein [Lysinibacillus fusiformis]SFH77630.1 phosphonate transport system permease protein [Lysinibacillus fusiformis]SFT08584.1 phosphonate transport system permease protein [Lysinibacillus fusiformis]